MRKIKIFVASSDELKSEREMLAKLANSLNNRLEPQDVTLIVVEWEDLDSKVSTEHERKQDDYNDKLRECEWCMAIFWRKLGAYSKEEFDLACEEMKKGNNLKNLYLYFRNCAESEKITAELQKFKDGIDKDYHHFYNTYNNIDELKAHFLLEFLGYLSDKVIGKQAAEQVVELRNGNVLIDNVVYVNLQNLPFVGNNEEYNHLQESIRDKMELLSIKKPEDKRYAELQGEIRAAKEKLQKMEANLWGTALDIAKSANKRSSERLDRARQLFMEGDNKGAQAILNEEEIDRDVEHNKHFFEQGKEGLETNREEYELRIRTLENEMAKGWLEEIVNLRKKILDICITLYGENNSETAKAYNNVGASYGKLGDEKTALEYKLKALKIREEVLGEKHPDTATSYNNVGASYGNLGEEKTALEYLLKALKIWEEVLGEKHPYTATSYDNVGYSYGELGDEKTALEYKLKALKIREEVLGNKHPDTATSYNNVGASYGNLGEEKTALEYLLKALKIREEVLGEKHPDTAKSYDNVGASYGNLGDEKTALEYHLKALKIREEVLGEKHPDTATSYDNVGCSYGNLGDEKAALEYHLKALKIREEVLGEKHPDTATSYNNVGYSYGNLGDWKTASEYLLKALKIREEVLGEKHPYTAQSYNNVGYSYGNLGDWKTALEYFSKAQGMK